MAHRRARCHVGPVERPRRFAVEETVDSSRTEPPRARGGESAARAQLIGVHPRPLRVRLDLDERPLVLGRAPDDPSSAPIVHRTVSRAHLQIAWDGVRHVARDLDSRNGSALDGLRLGARWRPLREGSVLRLGDVLLVYERGHELDALDPPEVSRDAIPGESLALRHLRTTVARAAPDISPALLIGETGTGKERLAAELHRLSNRPGELVAVNCATLGAHLVESQLFGHVKGAFTGATSDQPGLFRAAEGGTLFLDEIGEMPLELQPKLLRAIQEKEIRPVGSHREVRVDVRIVAATHRELESRARRGEFRQDLYARLALWRLELPPLRARRSDLLSWVERLHAEWARARGQALRPPSFDPEAATRLLLAPWPENLRGLDRFVHELAALPPGESPVRRHQLPTWLEGTS